MKNQKPKTFRIKLAKRIETEVQTQKQKRKKRVSSFLSKTSNLIVLIASFGLIAFFWQFKIATPFNEINRLLGKDYFNAYTYAQFFAKHIPFPPSGWMPFWNGGIPVIGGSSTTFFYQLYPLTKLFDIATSIELASVIPILLFLIFSHFLFWETSRNHIIAIILTLILGLTPATYYLLVKEGLLVGSAMQWYLPLTLLLIVRFIKFQQSHLLLISAVITGIAIISHPAIAILTILIPSILYLLIADSGDPLDAEHTYQLKLNKIFKSNRFKKKLSHATLFLLLSLLVGSIGIYSLVIQSILSTGSTPCSSESCWGQYPEHFSWFTPLLLPPIFVFTIAALITKLRHKKRFSEVLAPVVALTPLLLYVIAAKLQLINSITSAFFPRRLFWAITLLALTTAAASLRYTAKFSDKLAIASAAILITILSILIPLRPQTINYTITQIWETPQALPFGIREYLIPKYKIYDDQQLFPSWLSRHDKNFRLDSIRPDFFIWWNSVSDKPSTRGYSNLPTQEHLNWLYYLQSATIATSREKETNPQTYRNRALFLLDHFAIDTFLEFGEDKYHPLLINDPEIVIRTNSMRNMTYHQLSQEATSPIVAPINAARVLVISDQKGYETFVRALSLTNLNSRKIITIQGPKSIDRLDKNLLSSTDALVIYGHAGSKWKNIEDYILEGGQVFIDLGSITDENLPILPDFFGLYNLKILDEKTSWELSSNDSPLLNKVDTNKFSPLVFEDQPWKIIAPQSQSDLDSQIKTILIQQNSPILTQHKLGNGKIIFSGFNLPYHITNYQNSEETKLLTNILQELTPESLPIGEFSVNRPQPTHTTISTNKAKGIYFKENHHSGWKATLNGKKIPIYKAGLGFMYISLPQDSWNNSNLIDLRFQGNTVTWGLPFLSLSTILSVTLYILTPRPFIYIKKHVHWYIALPLRSWWKKE